jgi:hypothetical protein
MKPKSAPSRPNRDPRDPQPEITPPPGDVPKKFPEPTPLSDDGLEAAKQDTSGPGRTGSGEDPFVESGLPENDPERPRETPEEQSME